MKKKINQSQLENMIAECVGQVLAESRQPRQQKPARKVMNEAQLSRYIQGIINEEMENEGFWGKVKGAASGLGQSVSGGTSKQGKPYDNWDGGFGDNWSDEQWAEYKKKREEKYKDMPNRDYFNESKGFANKEQSKMMDWKKKRTDAFYDKDGKPISKKYTPRDKDGIPKPIKVRESQLHNIVKESINKVIQEGWFRNLFN